MKNKHVNKNTDDYATVRKLEEEKKMPEMPEEFTGEEETPFVMKNGGKHYLYVWLVVGAFILFIMLVKLIGLH